MKKTSTRVLAALLITLLAAGVYFYVTLPAINIYEQSFWVFIILASICFIAVYSLMALKGVGSKESGKKFFKLGVVKVAIAFVAVPVAVLLIGNILSSTFFNAEKYSTIIEVPEAVFEEDMPETAVVSNIALILIICLIPLELPVQLQL